MLEDSQMYAKFPRINIQTHCAPITVDLVSSVNLTNTSGQKDTVDCACTTHSPVQVELVKVERKLVYQRVYPQKQPLCLYTYLLL